MLAAQSSVAASAAAATVNVKIPIVWAVSLYVSLILGRLVAAVPPEYELEERFKHILEAIRYEIDDRPIVVPESRNVDAIVTYRCQNALDSPFEIVHIGDAELRSKLRIGQPVALIIHGWLDSYDRTWINGTARLYQKHVGTTNICVLDWSRLSYATYVRAAASTKPVARHLVGFLRQLLAAGWRMADITLIGHSFGAQIAGMAGAQLGGQLAQIYGLDPAGWSFTKPTVVDAALRLDRTDAKYVQCIHTNKDLFGLGTSMDCGHQDFYPNDGLGPQPGCTVPHDQGAPAIIYCSHFKSNDYFAMSLSPSAKWRGFRCAQGYQWWSRGFCNSRQFDYMGVHSRRAVLGKLYLRINAKSPFS